MPTDLIAAGLALLGGLVALALAMWRQRTKGRAEGTQAAADKAARDYRDTRRRMDDANNAGADTDADREWLRARGTKPRRDL